MLKPDVRIYEKFLETYGLAAEECLFADDTLANVEGARKAGMNAMQFKGDYEEIFGVLKADS